MLIVWTYVGKIINLHISNTFLYIWYKHMTLMYLSTQKVAHKYKMYYILFTFAICHLDARTCEIWWQEIRKKFLFSEEMTTVLVEVVLNVYDRNWWRRFLSSTENLNKNRSHKWIFHSNTAKFSLEELSNQHAGKTFSWDTKIMLVILPLNCKEKLMEQNCLSWEYPKLRKIKILK